MCTLEPKISPSVFLRPIFSQNRFSNNMGWALLGVCFSHDRGQKRFGNRGNDPPSPPPPPNSSSCSSAVGSPRCERRCDTPQVKCDPRRLYQSEMEFVTCVNACHTTKMRLRPRHGK